MATSLAEAVSRGGSRVLPTFLVIGAMKSGTTSLAQYLAAHDDVFITQDKEPNFFSRPDRYERGLEWYESLFAGSEGMRARGEASTSYTKFPNFAGTPERIAAVVPDVRLLYVVRQPIERLRSQYLHQVLRGQETRPLTDVVFEAPPYVDNSRYGAQLDQYLQHFDRSQLLVLTSDQLRGDRATTMATVYEFVGVDPTAQPEALDREFHGTATQSGARTFDVRLRAMPGRRLASRIAPAALRTGYRKLSTRQATDLEAAAELPPDVIHRLEDELHDDVLRLRDFLGPEFDGWGLV